MADFNFVHEDVIIMNFPYTLEDEALEWFENLGRNGIYSLANFIKVFLKHRNPHREDKYEEIFEDLMAAPSEENIVDNEAYTSFHIKDQAYEEAPHVSIEDSFSAIHEEDLDDEASISSIQED